MSTAPLLEVEGLAVEFRTVGGWRRVVDGVGFRLGRGEVLGIVGESGSGKSVTCRALMRLLPERIARVPEGRVALEGQDLLAVDEPALEKVRGDRIAMIFQTPSSYLDPVMRIGEQIAEGLILHQKLSRRAARARTIELLREVGIREPARQVDAYPHEFSGGMKQRAMIAAALCCEPKVLIADEPTTALDVTVQAQILDLLRRLRDDHDLAVVLVSHDLAVVAGFCDRVVVMTEGRIVESGPTGRIVTRPAHPYTRRLIGSQPDMVPPGGYFPEGDDAGPPARLRRPEPPAGPALLEVSDLGVTFAQPRGFMGWLRRRPLARTRAVDGVTLEVRHGETVGLVGESGSGKSTLARAVVRLVQADAGEIRIAGAPAANGAWRAVQMVFQDPLASLNPKRTVAAMLAEPLLVHRLCPKDEVPARVRALMAEVGLGPELALRRPHQLSGGQCQRVGIARALAVGPLLLLADEPTSALDVTIQAQILNLLMRLRDSRGLAILFISHDLAVVRHLCERVAVMAEGKLVEVGPAEQIFERPRHPYTRRLLQAIPRMAKDEGEAQLTPSFAMTGR